MAGLGIGIAFVGYWVMYYGVTQVQSGNWGFLDLGIPSRWANAAANPKDDGTNSSGPSAVSKGASLGQAAGGIASAATGVPGLPTAGKAAGGAAGAAVSGKAAETGLQRILKVFGLP